MARSYEMDLSSGPLLGKIVRFAVPLLLSGVLQLLFNAADVVVVGRFTGPQALAAVGSTTSLINLLVNLFIGVSVGANVLTARNYGAKNWKALHDTVHTAILTAMLCGCAMIFVGGALAEPILRMMGTPEDVLPHSVLYMRIYFMGMPFFITYNFGAAVLRAVGDTRRPLYFLTLAGVVNVALNLALVILFDMGVAGVAIATVTSQGISAALVLICLHGSTGPYRLVWRDLRIDPATLRSMLRIGVPAGLQGTVINFSNVLIQSSVNSFGSLAMAGYTASCNIDGFIYIVSNSVTQTALSFAGQNMGAGNYRRVEKAIGECVLLSGLLGASCGAAVYLLREILIGIYSPDPEVIAFGVIKFVVAWPFYFLAAIMDTLPGGLRGMGCSLAPTLISITGVCLFRVVWIFGVFPVWHSLESLYFSYPVSWALTVAMQAACYFIVRKKLLRPAQPSPAL